MTTERAFWALLYAPRLPVTADTAKNLAYDLASEAANGAFVALELALIAEADAAR